MRLNRAGYFLLFIACLAARGQLFAAGPGTTGANFLKIPVGARETALGGALTAAASGPGAVFYNPAGLALSEAPEVAYSYNNYFSGISQQWLAGALPVSYGAWGFGLNYLNVKAFDAYDAYDNRTGSVSAYDLAAYLGYGASFRTGLGFLPTARYGAAFKYITQKLDTENASGFSADAGLVFAAAPERLSFGLGAENFASSRLEFIGAGARPARKFKAGASYGLGAPGSAVSALLLADFNFPEDGPEYFSAGLENTFYGLLSLRAGYSSFGEISNGLTFGLGLGLPARAGRELRLDYSFGATYDLGSVHKFGVSCRFGGVQTGARAEPLVVVSAAAAEPEPVTAPVRGSEEDFKLRLELLYGNDPELSSGAAEYLAGLDDSRVLEHLSALLSSGRTEWRLAAVRGLKFSRDPRAGAELAKALRDQNPGLRKAAARAIAARGESGSKLTLETALKAEESDDVKSAIIEALVALGAGGSAPEGPR